MKLSDHHITDVPLNPESRQVLLLFLSYNRWWAGYILPSKICKDVLSQMHLHGPFKLKLNAAPGREAVAKALRRYVQDAPKVIAMLVRTAGPGETVRGAYSNLDPRKVASPIPPDGDTIFN